MATPFKFDEQDVLTRLEATSLSPQAQQELIVDVAGMLQNRVGARMETAMSDEQIKEFMTVIEDDPDGAKSAIWLEENLPEYHDWMREELDDIIENMKGTVKSITGK